MSITLKSILSIIDDLFTKVKNPIEKILRLYVASETLLAKKSIVRGFIRLS